MNTKLDRIPQLITYLCLVIPFAMMKQKYFYIHIHYLNISLDKNLESPLIEVNLPKEKVYPHMYL